MKTTVDTDLLIDATEEAKICFTCDKKRCTPVHCKRLNTRLKELKEAENERNSKER